MNLHIFVLLNLNKLFSLVNFEALKKLPQQLSGVRVDYLQTTKPAEMIVPGAMLLPTLLRVGRGLASGSGVSVIPFAKASKPTFALN